MAEIDDVLGSETEADSSASRPKAPLIENRFLYVDVAAMRAKQLRRGALPRLSVDEDGVDGPRAMPFKAERVAMEEVRRGLVLYETPPTTTPRPDDSR